MYVPTILERRFHHKKLRSNLHCTFLIIASAIVLVFGNGAARVFADNCPSGMSQQDCDSIYGNWTSWITDNGDCTSSVGDPTLLGSDHTEQAYNYFVGQAGLPAAAAAGIVGNLMEESGVDPTRLQGDYSTEHPSASLTQAQLNDATLGWGIAQWTPPSSIITASRQKSVGNSQIDTLAYQVQFLWSQLNSNPSYYELPQLKAATSPTQAADIFEAGFERAGVPALAVREKDAQDVYNQYANNGVSSAGVSAPTTTSGGCATSSGAGQNTQYAGSFPFYSQCDPSWGTMAYGDSTMCAVGCGPTAMAMIISALTNQTITPAQTAAYATSHNEYLPGEGTKWSIAPDLAAHWNLKATPVTTVAGVSAALQSGSLVAVAGLGSLPFTTAGHYIVIRAVTADGNWLLGDPDTAQGHSNTQEWNPQAVVSAGLEWGSAYIISK